MCCGFRIEIYQAKIEVLADGISSLARVEEPLAKCKSRTEVAEGLVLKQVGLRLIVCRVTYFMF